MKTFLTSAVLALSALTAHAAPEMRVLEGGNTLLTGLSDGSSYIFSKDYEQDATRSLVGMMRFMPDKKTTFTQVAIFWTKDCSEKYVYHDAEMRIKGADGKITTSTLRFVQYAGLTDADAIGRALCSVIGK